MGFEAILPALAEYAGKKIADKVFKDRTPVSKLSPVSERIEIAIGEHLARVDNWSASVGFFRLPASKDVDAETIPLQFSATPRKFRSTSNIARTLKEEDLLDSGQHLLILGPPGAGKTTTLKRMARTVLTHGPVGALDTYQSPIVMRLRDVSNSDATKHPLLVAIARELGLTIQIPEKRVSVEKKNPDGTTKIEEKVVRQDPLCEEAPITWILPKIINELNPVLFLDGLDEAQGGTRGLIEGDISVLLEAARTYKVIVTCRSGDYHSPIGYTSVIEVCELQETEIESLAERWLGDQASGFLKKIHNSTLTEIASRPLFLSHMLALFEIDGTLPEQPFELYELVVMLMIREWDRERKIQRKSRYGDFGPEKKRRFLAAIAYYLTYSSVVKIFTEADLVKIYNEIYRSFGLPADEARLVATEIESHTGLIVEAGSKNFEFSHLTIQEYLCAEHLVRSPFPGDGIGRLISLYPAPLAIATALSADPTGWLSGVLLSEKLISSVENETVGAQLTNFLSRLEFENPIFVSGRGLGFCILTLSFRHAAAKTDQDKTLLEKYMTRFLANGSVRRSFLDVITRTYRVTSKEGDRRYFVAVRDGSVGAATDRGLLDLPQGYQPPERGEISRQWLEKNFFAELLFEGIRVANRR